MVARLNHLLSHRLAPAVLLVFVAALYASAYVSHELFPGTGAEAATRGWWTWNDQHHYLDEAAALAQGQLTAARFHYPVGYPALAAPFWRAMPAHAFFLPDLVLVLVTAVFLWRIARRWLSPALTFAVMVWFVATHRWLIAETMIIPWNTLPTQAALTVGVWCTLAWEAPRRLWLLAALAAATYTLRPADDVAFAPLLLFAWATLPSWRARLAHGAGALAVLLTAFTLLGALNLHVYGTWRSSYESASIDQVGFFGQPFRYKLYWLLVDGRAFFHEWTPALLFRYPWLYFAPAGAAFFVQRERSRGIAVVTAILAHGWLYLNYNDLSPTNIDRFRLIHYLTWMFPLLFIATAAVVRHAWQMRWLRAYAVAALVAALIGAGLRLDEQSLPTGTPDAGGWPLPPARPLLVRFTPEPLEPEPHLFVDGRALAKYREFLRPYVNNPGEFLLSPSVVGERIRIAAAQPTGAPTFADYVWRWRWNPGRVSRLCQ